VAAVRTLLTRAVRIAAALLVLLIVGLAVAWSASREVRYVARAAVEEALILARRRPIAAVVADPSTGAFTRGRLQLVLAARDFAAESLHLAARRTYTTYSRLKRDTLVLVLSASPSDRLAAYTWSYPIVGRVPYKGFFDRAGALAEAARLERQGLDTYLRVSDAFSTLGWFNDPLLSTIVREDSVDLAATVIHEILHNTIWVSGDVPFNESLADFVGYRGAERLFLSRGDRRSAALAVARWQDEIRLSHFYDSLAARLQRLYTSGVQGALLEAERQRIFGEAQDALAGPFGRTLRTIDGRWLAHRPLNNAVVVAARLYRTGLDRFEALLAADGGDVVRVIADLKRRLAAGGDPWAALPSAGAGVGAGAGG
jgi:predicted aminopeptidase